MRDDYDRDREDRRERRRARRREYESQGGSGGRPVSALGVVALVKGIFALVASLIPCFGMFAIPLAAIALFLALLSIFVASRQKHSMGFPIAATAVSGSAVVASLLWIALFSAMIGRDERSPTRTVPPPAPVPAPLPRTNPVPAPKPPEPKLDDAEFEKKLLEDLAKDRIKETIRNGPGVPVAATDLEDEYNGNPVGADVRYKDKVLAVTGKVVRVVRDESKRVFTLELATGDATKTVSCDFTEQQKHMLVSVKRGDEVKVRGLCVGRVSEFVKLKDCVVAK